MLERLVYLTHGEDLVKLCIENNVKIIPIPGCVAFVQALICSGFDTTRFVFEGFLSVNKHARYEKLELLKSETRTMIFYEAPHKLKRTINDLYDYFGAERKIVFARELTKIHEEFLRFNLEEAKNYFEENDIKGEFVVLVEGNSTEKIDNKKSDEPIEVLYKKYLDEGLDKKDAMKKVAKDKGITKSEVYKYLL